MKLSIALHDSGIKKKTSKGSKIGLTDFSPYILILEKKFLAFLAKNPHFKGVKTVTISMTLCGKAKIRSLNRQYRQKDYPTDVLSFPVYDNLRPDKSVLEKNLPEVELGDHAGPSHG